MQKTAPQDYRGASIATHQRGAKLPTKVAYPAGKLRETKTRYIRVVLGGQLQRFVRPSGFSFCLLPEYF